MENRHTIRDFVLFFAVACGAGLWLYRAALNGAFISDDSFFVVGLGRNHPLDWSFVKSAFDPASPLKYEVMNYAPLYLLASRLEWAAFEWSTYGYHVVNVVLHALNAALLFALARGAGIGRGAALFAASFFLLHPANVETVAWISQLRSILGLGCAMGAILALRRHPALAAGLFAAGLLFKAAALCALPPALALAWTSHGQPSRQPISWRWLLVWVVCFCVYAYPQFSSWNYFGEAPVSRYADAAEQLRSMAEIGARYLLMAASSIGVSAFQEPEPAHSWLDPWWLASLPIGALLGWRSIACLVRRRDEGAYWLGAAAAFAPISQITPFYFAIGDRYVYFVLPWLIVGALLWAQELVGARVSLRSALSSRSGKVALSAVGVAVLVLFAARSMARAPMWRDQMALAREGAANFPDGGLAHWLRTIDLISAGDIDGGMREFETVIERGYYGYVSLFTLPEFAHLHETPQFVALRRRLARLAIEDLGKRGTPSQRQVRMAATAHYYLAEYDEALALFESGLEMEGPYRDKIVGEIAEVRERLSERDAAAGAER